MDETENQNIQTTEQPAPLVFHLYADIVKLVTRRRGGVEIAKLDKVCYARINRKHVMAI